MPTFLPEAFLGAGTLVKGHFYGVQMTLRPQPVGNFSAERAALAAHMVAEARRLHPHAIRFHFDVQPQARPPDAEAYFDKGLHTEFTQSSGRISEGDACCLCLHAIG